MRGNLLSRPVTGKPRLFCKVFERRFLFFQQNRLAVKRACKLSFKLSLSVALIPASYPASSRFAVIFSPLYVTLWFSNSASSFCVYAGSLSSKTEKACISSYTKYTLSKSIIVYNPHRILQYTPLSPVDLLEWGPAFPFSGKRLPWRLIMLFQQETVTVH